MMFTATEQLARFISEMRLDQIPRSIVQEGKKLVLDTLACILAAASTEIGRASTLQAGFFGEGMEATLLGQGRRSNALGAGYANGRLGNFLDFDETYPGGTVGGVHFGVGAVSAGLAMCERENLDGSRLLLSVIAGYELGGRVSDIGTQLVIKDDEIVGMPPIWGMSLPVVFAAVGSAGSALRLSPELMTEAFALAGALNPTSIGPMWAAMLLLPNTKYCDTGWCALTGMFSALSAREGSTGPGPILDGERSIFRMTGANHVKSEWMLEQLGARWALTNVTYKPWPTCRWHHQALTALARLRDEIDLKPDEVTRVLVETNTGLMSPRFMNQDPPNLVARQFSFPHAIAMLIERVPPGIDWLTDRNANSPSVAALRRKVTVKAHSEQRGRKCAQFFERDQIRQMPAAVTVEARGKTFRAESDFALGDPWNPGTRWSFDEIARKFCAVSGLSNDRAEIVIKLIRDLESVDRLSDLTEVLS